MNGETGQVRTALVENLKELHLPAMRAVLRGNGAASGKRNAELRAVSAGAGGAGVRGAAAKRIGKLLRNPDCRWRRPWRTST